MVLKVIDPNDASNVVPAVVDSKKLYVKHAYGGSDTLNFEIAIDNNAYKYILEETKIEYKNNRYLVKLIDEQEDFATVRCDIDLDDFKKTVLSPYRRTNVTLQDVLRDDICIPLGWTCTIDSTLLDKHTTVEESEGEAYVAVTPYTLLSKASEIFECVYEFNSISKEVKAKDVRNVSPSGQFFSDELNLRSVGYVGSSEELVTRLYAYGKKNNQGVPMTFASINDGKPYVDDNTYSNRIVVAIWSDERYTVAQNLLDDARLKLAEMAKPERSYTCDVNDVGEGVWLYKVVTLIDRKHQIRVNHMIVEYNEYEDKNFDSITLSTIEKKVVGGFEAIKESISEIVKNEVDIGDVIDAEIQRTTELLMGEKGGRFEWLYDGDGFPIELINYCSLNGSYPESETEQANWQNKWVWNENGLGFTSDGGSSFDLALTKDGKINASMITTGSLNAKYITAGVLQSAHNVGEEPATKLDLSSGLLSTNNIYITGGKIVMNYELPGEETATTSYIELRKEGLATKADLSSGIAYVGGYRTTDRNLKPVSQFYYNSNSNAGVSGILFTAAGNVYEHQDGGLIILPGWDLALISKTSASFYVPIKAVNQTIEALKIGARYYDLLSSSGSPKTIIGYDNQARSKIELDVANLGTIWSNYLLTTNSSSSSIGTSANPFKSIFCGGIQTGDLYIPSGGGTNFRVLVRNALSESDKIIDVNGISLKTLNYYIVFQKLYGTFALGTDSYPITFWGEYADFKMSDVRIQGTSLQQWIKNNLTPASGGGWA